MNKRQFIVREKFISLMFFEKTLNARKGKIQIADSYEICVLDRNFHIQTINSIIKYHRVKNKFFYRVTKNQTS